VYVFFKHYKKFALKYNKSLLILIINLQSVVLIFTCRFFVNYG